jgi:hypothetical protein
MAPTPVQQQRRDRVEGLIGLAAPFLDLMLAAGDRFSRLVSPDDDYTPIRPPSEAFELERERAGSAPARRLDD